MSFSKTESDSTWAKFEPKHIRRDKLDFADDAFVDTYNLDSKKKETRGRIVIRGNTVFDSVEIMALHCTERRINNALKELRQIEAMRGGTHANKRV